RMPSQSSAKSAGIFVRAYRLLRSPSEVPVKSRWFLLVALTLIAPVAPPGRGADAPASTAPAATGSAPSSGGAGAGIQRVAWLARCWELSSNGRTVEEHWMAPRGKNMINAGRTMKGDTLVEFEQVVLREEGDRLAYEAHPSSQPSAVFMSTTVGDGSVVFENPDHDFPQRVGYDRKGDALVGWIEGMRDGKIRRIEFPYRHVPCPGN